MIVGNVGGINVADGLPLGGNELEAQRRDQLCTTQTMGRKNDGCAWFGSAFTFALLCGIGLGSGGRHEARLVGI
jgi:hypothetical protein